MYMYVCRDLRRCLFRCSGAEIRIVDLSLSLSVVYGQLDGCNVATKYTRTEPNHHHSKDVIVSFQFCGRQKVDVSWDAVVVAVRTRPSSLHTPRSISVCQL